MKVKRIFAPDMRQAMRRARAEIGPDAVIVSNHRVAGGVEVVAAHEQDFEWAQAQFQREYQQNRSTVHPEAVSTNVSSTASTTVPERPATEQLQDEMQKARQRLARAQQQQQLESMAYQAHGQRNQQIESDDDDLQTILESLKARQRAVQADEAILDEPVSPPSRLSDYSPPQDVISTMQHEIEQLKSLLALRVETPPPTPPSAQLRHSPAPSSSKSRLAQRFSRMGLSSQVSEQLLRGLEADVAVNQAWRTGLTRLAEAVPVMGEDYISRGGMIAFVGPTGVGKTTTIGKLAARYVLQHGSAGVALVTTDCYRIAAHEQLKTFGRILDVPVRVVDERHSLDEVLQSLRSKRLVLIDTAGMNQHEQPSQAQKAMLTQVRVRLKKLLVLSCSSQRQVIEDAYANYQSIGLDGCVLSKLDESGSLGEALSVAIEKKLPIGYVTDGQKVPDDIEVAQRNDLVSRAVITAQKALERERARHGATTGGTGLSSAG